MSDNSVVVYIDESGDEGFAFGRGSSEWFVLTGIIVAKTEDIKLVSVMRNLRLQLNLPEKKPLHFTKLDRIQRILYLRTIANCNITAISILIHKPSITNSEQYVGNYQLYFMAVELLLECISYSCKDKFGFSEYKVNVMFSKRESMSYDKLRTYLVNTKKNE